MYIYIYACIHIYIYIYIHIYIYIYTYTSILYPGVQRGEHPGPEESRRQSEKGLINILYYYSLMRVQ